MKKITLALIAVVALLAACTKSEITPDPKPEPEPEPKPAVEYPKITINANKSDLSLFENVDAFLGLEGEKADPFDIGITYMGVFDSVHWEIPKMYFESKTKSSVTVKVGFAFSIPGTYTLYLSAFKDNAVVRRDSVEFHVKNTKDFLGINWKDGKDIEFYSSNNTFSKEYFNLKSNITGDKPFARLEFGLGRGTLGNEYSEISFNALTRCINTNFGESQFSYSGDVKKTNLFGKYKELFKNPLDEKYYPIKIWQTAKNNIVLLAQPAQDPINSSETYYLVMAEPRNQ
ncbi:hypothetical protein [Sphingobacterium mizutaii]|uniref:hypothetical protein n=1 Tax=Sphingobacterium mizutaii TaxID=1010 RepID=UPI001625559B|nr:hypothetical protein [Sphingobacterium mizutaii]